MMIIGELCPGFVCESASLWISAAVDILAFSAANSGILPCSRLVSDPTIGLLYAPPESMIKVWT
jgi:hypothetical protein